MPDAPVAPPHCFSDVSTKRAAERLAFHFLRGFSER